MSNSGGVRAWQFLRRNPAYVEAWRNREAAGWFHASIPAVIAPSSSASPNAVAST